MRKLTAIGILGILAYLPISAQQNANSIKGAVSDTLNKQALFKAVVSMIRAKDSILVKFARTDLKGRFEIRDLPPGKYVLLSSLSNYADYTDTLTITTNSSVDLGTIPLITKAHLLEEVVVKQTVSAIKLKGDTTEYKADSFKVQANASVEELLKILPGIQVDKNGQITARGKTVQKVLVDGEEFFGDDPTLVTQNIRADMVDKVQVFDKKSDQAVFTGIDDGKKTTTINLKLKDNKKHGFFGKLDVGAASNRFYNEQLMFNKFQRKEKLSFYGILSNTGKLGLNWQDQNSYGDNSSTIQLDENGNITGRDELSDWSGGYSGRGYPKVQTGGVHYNNKWGDDKQAINGNYKVLDLSVTGNSNTSSQYILPDTSYYINQQQLFSNRITRNKGNLIYDVDFDSSSSLKVIIEAGGDHKTSFTQYATLSLAQDKSLVNQGNRTLTSTGDLNSFNSGFLWRKKLKKKGRTFSLDVKENYNTNVSTGFLYADNQFYKGGQQTGSQVTDQYKVLSSRLLAFNAKATYTEPLSKVASLVFNYGVTVNNNSSNRSSFNKSTAGKYEMQDSVYSNDYTFNIFTQSGGASYALSLKKFKLNAGNTIGYTNFSQTDNRTLLTGKRDFVNWFPQSYLSYAFTSQRQLYLSYNGATIQPTLQQIQPLRTNDDPLNIVIGNALLRPSFRNNINLNYYDYKALSHTNVYFGISYNAVSNAFANKEFVESLGRRVSQSINVNGNRSINSYFNYGFQLFGAHFGVNGNVNDSRFVNIVNNLENVTQSQTYSIGLSAGKTIEKFYANSISSNISYTTSQSSIQKNISTHYWTYNIRPDLDFYLPWKLQIHTDCDFIFRQKTSVFDNNNNIVLLNAWFGKKLLAGDALLIKVSVNDLFNQNIGFNRTVNTNFITENTYSTIQRYFMLSAVWSFNKGPKQQP
jgi:hypothetical protein